MSDSRNAQLIAAIWQSDYETVKKILDLKVDVNAVLSYSHLGLTALHYAVNEGDGELCRLLIKRGASLCSVSSQTYFDTPIARAFFFKKFE
jgi:ankyrin repeat protein